MEIVEALRRDQEAPRHPSDGGGRARFLRTASPISVSQPGTWSFVFEAGHMGIAEGGWLFFQAPPFWGWSTPQVLEPAGLGYTEVSSSAEGVSLIPSTIDQQLLAIQVAGRALKEGEEIVVEFGVGPAGALADRFAESRSCFFFAVDGDGDGVRSLAGQPLCVEVLAAEPAGLSLILPTTARPGDRVHLRLAVLDGSGNRVTKWTGKVHLEGSAGVEISEGADLRAEDAGARVLDLEVPQAGMFRVKGSTASGLEGESNPLWVSEQGDRVLWADLHGHSGLSDGTGTPKDYYRYARDVAGLDVVALTDHDHWGMQPLAVHPELWEEIRRETELFHRPDEFVTLLGFEWTSWIHGHRHVLYFSDEGQVLSSVDVNFETPLQLWDALRGRDALTFAHHSAGGPVATNWDYAPDPELEPVTEIVSVHGSSEALDSPAMIYSPVAGNFVRDVLDRGFELGFVGSGDGHDGHPGLAHLNAVSGGVAAILSEEQTRAGVLEALRARRVYATNGPRILLQVSLGSHPMGTVLETLSFGSLPPERRVLDILVVGSDTLESLDLIRTGEIVDRIPCGQLRCTAKIMVEDPEVGEYLYVRALQTDGGAAWSSPFFFR